MKIALIGASGYVGGALLKEAAGRGHAVTAIVRNPAKVAEQAGVTAIKADVTDAKALADLLKGHDVVVSAFNGGWGDPDIYTKHMAGSKAIAAAAEAAGVRLVEIGAARDALTELQKGDWKDWTLVSPAITLAPGQRTGKYRLSLDNPVFDAKGESHISVEDFAVAVLDEAETPKHFGERFTVGY